MNPQAFDNSSSELTAAEYRRMQELANAAGMGIQAFKRQCVREYMAQLCPNPRVGRGWIAINLDFHTEQRFRAAAALAGMKFQLFCRFALMDYAETLEKKFAGYGKLPPRRIKLLAAFRALVSNVGGLFPAKN
ncbi:MAG: hypothetical protein V9H26_19615 [Verrucomicrobiota bacterium]